MEYVEILNVILNEILNEMNYFFFFYNINYFLNFNHFLGLTKQLCVDVLTICITVCSYVIYDEVVCFF
jgi:hypothetical protein